MPDSPSSVNRDLRDLVDPVVVVAFGGWNDAGNAATGAIEHLAEAAQPGPQLRRVPRVRHDHGLPSPGSFLERLTRQRSSNERSMVSRSVRSKL